MVAFGSVDPLFSEIEVKSDQQTVAAQISSGDGRGTALADPRILIVKRETSPTGHKRVVPVANDIVVDIPLVRGHTGEGLL